jgi:hypothetical protein
MQLIIQVVYKEKYEKLKKNENNTMTNDERDLDVFLSIVSPCHKHLPFLVVIVFLLGARWVAVKVLWTIWARLR